MALLASRAMAAAGGSASQKIQRAAFLSSSSEISSLLYPYPLNCPPVLRKARTTAGKRIATTCTMIRINRPASEEDQLPESSGTEAVPAKAATSKNKGWTNAMDMPDHSLVSQLKMLATLASDRSETHHVLSVQRDNWNMLFHSTITIASVSASVAAALNGAEHGLGLSVVASVLGLGVAALMALVNFFQPSQLAEEQRHAARFFKRLAADIEFTLETDPRLRQEATHYLKEKLGTLRALDTGFPMPLTPIVLEKFPKVIRPSVLSGLLVDLGAAPQTVRATGFQSINGWTSALEEDLERTSQILHRSDVPTYVDNAVLVNHLNKNLAIASTVMSSLATLCILMESSVLGGGLMAGAYFVYSLSHAVQLGAAYETYRNCAGFYADVEKSIESALRVPVEERENGVLLLERIALQLGRSPTQSPLVPLGEKNAGTLF